MSNLINNSPISKWKKGIDLCNRTACQSPVNVFFFNNVTQAFYCDTCAELINASDTLCVLDDTKKIFEDKFKFQLQIDWSEFNKASESFTF